MTIKILPNSKILQKKEFLTSFQFNFFSNKFFLHFELNFILNFFDLG